LIFRYEERAYTVSDLDLVDFHQEAEKPMKNPPHPGDLIRTEIIEALGLSVSKTPEILRVRRAWDSDTHRDHARYGNPDSYRFRRME
jgi:hypothetical protein